MQLPYCINTRSKENHLQSSVVIVSVVIVMVVVVAILVVVIVLTIIVVVVVVVVVSVVLNRVFLWLLSCGLARPSSRLPLVMSCYRCHR